MTGDSRWYVNFDRPKDVLESFGSLDFSGQTGPILTAELTDSVGDAIAKNGAPLVRAVRQAVELGGTVGAGFRDVSSPIPPAILWCAYDLVYLMRRVEIVCKTWSARSRRQQVATVFGCVPPVAKMLFRPFVVAPRGDLRLVVATGDRFPENSETAQRLDSSEAKFILASLDDTGEVNIQGSIAKYMQDIGIIHYVSKGLSGNWFLNIPVLTSEDAASFRKAVLSKLGPRPEEEMKPLLDAFLRVWKSREGPHGSPDNGRLSAEDGDIRCRSSRGHTGAGPGDFLEMCYAVLGDQLIGVALDAWDSRRTGYDERSSGAKMGDRGPGGSKQRGGFLGRILSVFGPSRKPAPQGVFLVREADKVWEDIVAGQL